MAIEPVVIYSSLKTDLEKYTSDLSSEITALDTPLSAAAKSLNRSFLRKLRTGKNDMTDAAALSKFLACNTACKEWALPTDLSVDQQEMLGAIRQHLYNFWYRRTGPLQDQALISDPWVILDNSRVGPGAAIGARGNDFYSKLFSSPLTTTSQFLYSWYRVYTDKLPIWKQAETNRLIQYGQPRVVQGNRLSFVPKNDEISRCICIEPSLNMLFQLGICNILERRLNERFGISLSRQPTRNRSLARLGSITDSLSTIDLSSASDSMSLKMLQSMLPRSFYELLVRYRSPHCEVPKLGTIELHMISTMGNGSTFPLQTILFSAVVAGVMQHREIRGWNTCTTNSWGVFGDDIICPKSVTQDVISMLALLGFKVNSDKTFVEGPFRESCGSDFFYGSEIRGVYAKAFDTVEARYSVFNLLARFSTRTGVYLGNTLRLLYNSVPKLFVPPWEDLSCGLHVPLSAFEVRPRNGTTYSYYYRKRVPRLVYHDCREDYIKSPRNRKRLMYNPEGLLVSLLQGGISSGKIGIREDTVRYRTKRCVAPYWDASHGVEPESQDYGIDWRRWESVVLSAIERWS